VALYLIFCREKKNWLWAVLTAETARINTSGQALAIRFRNRQRL
jgi:hypothetical protein